MGEYVEGGTRAGAGEGDGGCLSVRISYLSMRSLNGGFAVYRGCEEAEQRKMR